MKLLLGYIYHVNMLLKLNIFSELEIFILWKALFWLLLEVINFEYGRSNTLT